MLPLCSFAQSSRDSLSFISSIWNKSFFSTKFDKQLNTYNFGTAFSFSRKFDNLIVGMSENYNSTLIRAIPKNIKDEHYFSFLSEYAFADNLKLGLLANNNILSDDRKIALNQASLLNASLYTKWMPAERVYLAPFGGYSNSNQIGENDFGYLYGLEGLADNLPLSDFGLQSTVKFMNEDISPRKNTLRLFSTNLTNDFNNSFKNLLNAYYFQTRKDFYFSADSIVALKFNVVNNIQSRTETNYFIQDRFSFNSPADDLSLDFQGRAIWRNVDRDTRYRDLMSTSASLFDARVEEFKLEFESNTYYKSSLLDGIVRFNYSERDERHLVKKIAEPNIFLQEERQKSFEERSRLETQKNNKEIRMAISLIGNFKLSRRDMLSFSLLHNKLRYDTPSEENFDDRDELLSIFRVYYLRNLNPFFDFFVNMEGNLNHIVYIFAERSSNNNYMRLLKFASGGNYKGRNISSRNSFEVSANYTVYDFEDISPNYRSFSFRQMSMQDSTTIMLNRSLGFSVFGSLKFSEQGDFNWARFAGKPVRNLEEIYIEPKFLFRLPGVTLGCGGRYLSLKTYSYRDKQKVKESDYISIGPLTELLVMLNNRLYLRLYGWYEFIRVSATRRELPSLNIQMNWEL